jgi:hypothetical protein
MDLKVPEITRVAIAPTDRPRNCDSGRISSGRYAVQADAVDSETTANGVANSVVAASGVAASEVADAKLDWSGANQRCLARSINPDFSFRNGWGSVTKGRRGLRTAITDYEQR